MSSFIKQNIKKQKKQLICVADDAAAAAVCVFVASCDLNVPFDGIQQKTANFCLRP